MWAVQHATLCQMMFFVNRSRKTNAPADWIGALRGPLDFSLRALFRPIAVTLQTFWRSGSRDSSGKNGGVTICLTVPITITPVKKLSTVPKRIQAAIASQ